MLIARMNSIRIVLWGLVLAFDTINHTCPFFCESTRYICRTFAIV